jgi:hypothetical protein
VAVARFAGSQQRAVEQFGAGNKVVVAVAPVVVGNAFDLAESHG